ncbi:MAG TPA: hypothetical protein VHE79_05995, partial [Spirochaetia bacterium]
MKAFLMHRDKDFDLSREPPGNANDLVQDLELTTLFDAMANEDQFLLGIVKRAVLCSLTDADEILYRQKVLADCIEHPTVVREMYRISVDAIEAERHVYSPFYRDSPDSILYRSVQLLQAFVGNLKQLRNLAAESSAAFVSEGFSRFFAMLRKELEDDYFRVVESHLSELRFRRGMLMSARLGVGNKGESYILRKPRDLGWLKRLFGGDRSGYTFFIPERDESGFKALSELKGRGVNQVANAAAQSADHILSFFRMLRSELAFYVGCLNLRESLKQHGLPMSFPAPLPAGTPCIIAHGLYDACLALKVDGRVTGNDLRAKGKLLIMITGANQGGKSTFLRSLGIAQVAMQCGLFVPAESFRADICRAVFTHYKREEDAAMKSGKLDEELQRMSGIADSIAPDCLLLCNESFAATNEREGSEIARQVTRAFIENGIKVIYVTHLFDLAHSYATAGLDTALFLRAERRVDGHRTYRIGEGEPLSTSFGEDSYRRIFEESTADGDSGPSMSSPPLAPIGASGP